MPVVPSAYGLVIDDHPLVARGIVAFVQTHPLLAEVAHAGSVAAARRLIAQRGSPALVLIDFWLGAEPSTQWLDWLREHHPDTRILATSGDARHEVCAALRAAGAHGFVGKQDPPQRLHDAISALLAGRDWFEAESPVAPAAAGAPAQELPVTAAELRLTERQGEILALLMACLPNKRIAQRLALSDATVKEHVSGIFARLGTHSRYELLARMRGRRLVAGEGA